MSTPLTRRRAVGLAALAVSLLAVFPVPSARAAATDGVAFTVTLNDRPAAAADANDPLRLSPDDGVVLSVDVTNSGTAPVDVRTVKFDGQVLGLAFFTYSTRVDLRLEPGATGSRSFQLDLFDLGGQATGLLPARVALLGTDRQILAEQPLVVDVRGKVTSVYGVFGLALLAITVLLFLGLLARLVSGRLPENRLSRAWRFVLPGLGLGLTATIGASVLRVFVPSPRTSLVLLLLGGAVGFVAGYLSPNPAPAGDENELDARDLSFDGPELISLDPKTVTLPDAGRRTVPGSLPAPPPQ